MPYFRYGSREISHLKKRDKKLGAAIDEIGIIGREVTPDLFTALVASIASQQISAKAATTVWRRMEERLGAVTPASIASVTPEEIQQCGMSLRKATYIKGIGDIVAGGTLDLTLLQHIPDDEVIARLTSLNGVGVWTAEMLLIFSMERPDVLSWGGPRDPTGNDATVRDGCDRSYSIRAVPQTVLAVRFGCLTLSVGDCSQVDEPGRKIMDCAYQTVSLRGVFLICTNHLAPNTTKLSLTQIDMS